MTESSKKSGTILIVEDVASIRELLAEKLSHAGFRALQARNGEEGLRLAIHKHPDLILCDVIMPVMDGLAMARQLAARPETSSIPIMFLSVITRDEMPPEFLNNEHAYGYLWKYELSMDEIIHRVIHRLDPNHHWLSKNKGQDSTL